MAVNLPPQYHDAEARYKKARSAEEKLAALKEMWVILPKHKASEKVQADLKTKISELTDQIEHEKTAPKKAPPGVHKIPRQGAGQVVFLGPPATQAVIDRLKLVRRELTGTGVPRDDDPTTYYLKTLLAATKADDEAADVRLEIARETFGGRFPVFVISAEQGTGLEELRKA